MLRCADDSPKMAVAEAAGLLATLRATAASDPAKAKDLVTRLKILMTEFPSQTGAAAPTEQEAAITREVLEQAALLAVSSGDAKAFERNIAQLKPYYSASLTGEADTARRHMVGLLLMHLLTGAKFVEFHAEVESLILCEGDRAHPYLAFPLALERFLVEGSYHKILASRASVPSPHYARFMGQLVTTARDDIADCAEAAYPSLTLAAAQKLMMFDTPAQAAAHIAEHRPTWTVSATGTITFAAAGAAAPSGKATAGGAGVDAMSLMASTLGYASELEKIV